MKLSRRNFLKGVGVAGAAAVLPGMAGCADDEESTDNLPHYDYTGPLGSETIFSHGVASGDPLADAIVLWTRVTEPGDDQVEVFWEIAEKQDFRNRAAVGYETADADRDFTVKVDVTGLRPGTTYYYRFSAKGRQSVMGRTRTAPEGANQHLRLAVCSCSSLAHGFFQLYREMAQMADLDAVLHLGDYIYEYGHGGYGSVRAYEPSHEIVTLEDYRTRHNQYKRDPDLQLVHQQHPFICVWDDHESANNAWREGAENHTPETEGDWKVRRAAAEQAYFEWLPIREVEPNADGYYRIWRHLPYGDLVDLIMLDTRLWGRDYEKGEPSPERTLLGLDQEQWLGERLAASKAKWKFLGQQVMCGQLAIAGEGVVLNSDQWDGYAEARERLFQQIEATPGGNVVVLTGDIHTAWAIELTRSPSSPDYVPGTGANTVAVEFVTSAITSPGLAFLPANSPVIERVFAETSPHMRYYNLSQRGFFVLDITPERTQADFYEATDITTVESEIYWATAWVVEDGKAALTLAEAPAAPRSAISPLAPYEIRLTGFPGTDI